jgi:hypothetical protein
MMIVKPKTLTVIKNTKNTTENFHHPTPTKPPALTASHRNMASTASSSGTFFPLFQLSHSPTLPAAASK